MGECLSDRDIRFAYAQASGETIADLNVVTVFIKNEFPVAKTAEQAGSLAWRISTGSNPFAIYPAGRVLPRMNIG